MTQLQPTDFFSAIPSYHIYCLSRICYKSVSFYLESVTAAAPPTMVLPNSLQILPSTFYPFITTIVPFDFFINPFSDLQQQPLKSRVPNEINFFFTFGTCHTSPNVLTTLSNIFILIDPIPTTLQEASLPIRTKPQLTDL